MSGFRRGMIANATASDPMLKVPLTFTAEEAGATVTLNVYGSVTIPAMHYRMGKSGLWLPYTAGTVIDLPNIGDSVQFWNNAETLSAWTNDYAGFSLPKKVAASGNIQSMLNWRTDCPFRCFNQLFLGVKLTSLPLMPAKIIGGSSYYNMYGNYSKIYQTKLILDFPLSTESFLHMFQFATGFEAVELRGERTETVNMRAMFRGCTTLKEITVHFTSWVGESSDWVLDVSSGGTFYKPSALPEEYGTARIPEGWTVVNID